MYEFEDDAEIWIGRMGGEKQIIKDVRFNNWRQRKYCVNSIKPKKGQPGNWIPLTKFKELVSKFD